MQGPNCKMQGPKWKMQNKSPPSRAANFFTPFLFFFDHGAGGAVWAAPYRRYGHGRAPLHTTL
ncbi:hypothetical protein Hanom_Chr02g00149111 [Helianthus anomalus]